MATLSKDRWQEISPHLDAVLSMPDEERTAWISEFRREKPEQAQLLEELLQEQVAVDKEDFLSIGPHSAPEISLAGQVVGAYRLLSPIGEGGMGAVWLAERSDGRFDRQVAIKFLRFSLGSPSNSERFKREGKILGLLAHPHIAELIDAGIVFSGQPYIVLEHIDGEPIDAYCDKHHLDVNARIRLFLDVLSAVSHAHASLVVHRDIKPSNVLVRHDGFVKLLDFGIAKLLDDESAAGLATKLTLEGGGALTPQYAAPEQVMGGPVTTATDVYALGALLYLLLTGKHPTGSGALSPAELVKAIVETIPARPSDAVLSNKSAMPAEAFASTPEKLKRAMRGDLDTIIGKALKKNPAERYSSVTALADDLRRFLTHQPISARPDSFSYITAKFVRRNRTGVIIAAVGLLAAVSAAAGILVQTREARKQRDVALRELARANRITEFMMDMFKTSDPSEARGNSVTAREILDKASKNIDPGLEDDPLLQAEMMHVMGNVYRRLGLYSEAQSLLERSIHIAQNASGSEKAEVLLTMNDLAVVLTFESRAADAEKLQREALQIEQRVLEPDDPTTVKTMSDLASTLDEESRHAEAIAIDTKVLEIQRRTVGATDARTLGTMNNLAMMLARNNQLSASEALQRENIDLLRKAHGPDDPELLNSMDNLGATLIFESRYADAEQVLDQTLQLQKQVLGPSHPDTAHTAYNLACVAARLGQRDKALSILGDIIPLVPPRLLPKIAKDEDLDSLHTDPRWNALMQSAAQRLAQARSHSN